jgi:chromosome partitioning protein
MTTIAVTNRKGGVGKTTHSIHLATGLATLGYRVAIIDTDSQGHVAFSLNIERSDALFDVLVENQPLQQHVILVAPDAYSIPDYPARGHLFALSGFNKTYRIPHELGEFGAFRFLNMVDKLKKEFQLHFVIIDTSPTLKDFDTHIYMTADAYLYITEPESMALDGLDKAIQQMFTIVEDRKQHLNRPTAVLGVLPNKVRNTRAHDIAMQELESKYADIIFPRIRLDTVWAEASLVQEVLYKFAPSSNATKNAWAVTVKVLEVIQKWQHAMS